MEIKGDLKGDTRGFETSKLVNLNSDEKPKAYAAAGDKASTDFIGFEGSGNNIITENVWIQGDKIDIGVDNTIIARKELNLDVAELSGVRIGGRATSGEFLISKGRIVVGDEIRSSNKNTINVGEKSVAALELGHASLKRDEMGNLSAAGKLGELESHSSKTGLISANIKLDGQDKERQSELAVAYGTWNLSDVEATNGRISVGKAIDGLDTSKINYDGGRPSVSFNKLTLKEGSALDVHAGTTANIKNLDMTDGTVKIWGDAVVGKAEGSVTEEQAKEYAYKVTSGTVTVIGRDAMLTIGKEALAGIKLRDDPPAPPAPEGGDQGGQQGTPEAQGDTEQTAGMLAGNLYAEGTSGDQSSGNQTQPAIRLQPILIQTISMLMSSYLTSVAL